MRERCTTGPGWALLLVSASRRIWARPGRSRPTRPRNLYSARKGARNGPSVKIGAPHFVDFGKNMEHSPDGKAYLVCHGTVEPDPKPRFGNNSWGTGDQLFLLRVQPSVENINDASKYEFFAGHDAAGAPIWTRDFAQIKPLADWNNRMGCVTMTYDPPLKRYLMCVLDAVTTFGRMNTFVLESERITGPWKLVTFMKEFGRQGYFPNFPSKFIGADGRTLWLCYAANFGCADPPMPPGSRYGMCLQEVTLRSPGDPLPPPNPLHTADNVAGKAVVTASSVCPGYQARAAVDGYVGGFPAEKDYEWASQGERDTAMLRLTWAEPQRIDRIWLFDRPSPIDRITSAMLVFSDGTTIPVGALPDDAKKGIEVKFEPKTVKWLALFITGVSPTTQNVGLSEIAVFRAAK